jgi:hypothetical protein
MASPFECERCGAVLPGSPSYAVEFPEGDLFHVCAECVSNRPDRTTATAFDDLSDAEHDRLAEAVAGRLFNALLADAFASAPDHPE